MIASSGNASTDKRDASIKSGRCKSLEAPLTAAVDDDGLAVPFWLLCQEVDRTNQTEKHPFEITLFAILSALAAIIF